MNTLRITGGKVLRPDMTVESADVLIDRDEGTILDIGAEIDEGTSSARRKNSDDIDTEATESLDAEGCLVMPGLVNAHCHAAMTLLRGHADDKELDAWLREDIWPAEAALTPEDVRVGTELGILEMIKSGTTAFADMYFEVPEVAAAIEKSGVRARIGHGVVTIGKDEDDAWADVEESLDIAREFDGAADGRIHTAVMPHSLTTVGEAYLHEIVAGARDDDVPLHYHANETTAEVDPIVEERDERPLSYAKKLGMLTDSDFIAHGVHTDSEEIDLLADAGTGVVHCPASNMKLASGMAPIQDMLDAGVTVGLGTDGAASNNDLDLFDEMRDAAMLGKLASDDASAVAAPDVVRMATAGSADAIGLPGGRLEVGAVADIAVVDLDAPHLTPANNLVSHLAYAARGSDVRHTVCDGQVLMRDGEVLTLDEEAVKARARDAAADLFERV